MANLIDISNTEKRESFNKRLRKIIQSTNINFLIGSGCSYPAIKVLGDIENRINEFRVKGDNDKAEKLLHDFLVPFLDNTKQLLNDNITLLVDVISNYKNFLKTINEILFNRKNNIIPSQAIIFSTNYDMFIEYAMGECIETSLLCDGFKRTSSINNEYYFSPSEYFNMIYNTGNLYKYKVEIPLINLIKLHGSLNWNIKDKKIIQDLSYLDEAEKLKNSKSIIDIKKFNSLFKIVLPENNKFNITITEQVYYDLLRIYSNELDKENTVLIVEGFSFADQHILDLTIRALKNKTFNLIIFCFNEKDKTTLSAIYELYRNVDIVFNRNENLDFKFFIEIISEIISLKENEI